LKTDTKTLAGTAILGAFVVVFDYSLKYSGFKIPFPWLPYLKFDFTGVPIVLSLLFFGLASGITTSAVALLAILARSGDVVGATMKALAEFSTILGMAIGLRLLKRNTKPTKILSSALGLSLRSIVMLLANLIVFPTMAVTYAIPLLIFFNAIQGSISIIFGYFLYGVVAQKLSFPSPRKESR
jgi:riboflavin transporter FmnP